MVRQKQNSNYLSYDHLYRLSTPSKNKTSYYPGTEIEILPGDVIYSSKGWSTFLAGHAGLIGHDYRVYHSHPRGGFADKLPSFLSRHKFGSTLTILRPKEGGSAAAEWAMNNIGLVQTYLFDPRLRGVAVNYCTKFIWQAFWHAGCGDITYRNLTAKKVRWIYPVSVKQSAFFEEKAEIKLSRKSFNK